MRRTWKRALSTLLTLAMLATLLVVPVSAAADMTLDMTNTTATTGNLSADTDLVTDGSFKWVSGGGSSDKIAEKNVSFTTEGYTYSGTKAVQWGGNSSSGSKRTIDFTTSKVSTITVWWENLKSNGSSTISIWSGSDKTLQTATSGGTSSTTQYELNVAVFEKVPAGTQKLGFSTEKGGVYKIEVAYPTAHSITVATDIENGTVSLEEGVTTATAGTTVTVTATPNTDKQLKTLTYTVEGQDAVNITTKVDGQDNQYTFTMPDADVTINATFGEVCNHENTTTQNQKDATCAEDGYTGDTVCTDCNAIVTAGSVISKSTVEHTPGDAEGESTATCTTDGSTGTIKCTVCGAVTTEATTIPRTGHTFSTDAIGTKCDNCDVTLPDHLDIMFGESGASSDNKPTSDEMGYITEYAGGGTGSSYGATYTKVDGTEVPLSNGHTKFNASGLLTFKAPGAGTLTFCFDADQGTNISVNDETKTWDSTTGLLVLENVTAGTTYTLKQGTGEARLFAIGWKSTNYVAKHSVSYSLTNITEPETTEVAENGELSVTLTAATGYTLPETITVTMGGATLTSGYIYDKSTGTVTISSVSGDVTITASAVAIPKTMNVNVAPPTALTYDGTAKTVTVTATGENDADLTESATITYATEESGTYTATQPEMKNVGSYTVYVKVNADGYTEGAGSVTFTITKADCPTLNVTSSPSALGSAGGNVTVTVTGVPTDSNTTPAVTVESSTGVTVGDVTKATGSDDYTATVTLPENTGSDDVTYTIKANWAGDGNYNAATEATATVTVHPAGSIVLNAGKDDEKTVTTATEGETLTFAVTASATVDNSADGVTLSYQWKVDGEEIEDATDATYSVTADTSLTGKVYSCVVTAKKDGSTDATATVTFDAVQVNEQTKTVTFETDNGVDSLTVKVNGTETELKDKTLTVARSAVVTFLVNLKENYAIQSVTGATAKDGVYTVTADTVTVTTEEVAVVDPDAPVETTMQFAVEKKHATTYTEETKVDTGVVGVELWFGADSAGYNYYEPATGDLTDYAGSIQGSSANPKDASNKSPTATNVPVTGCYYKFVVTQDGTLSVDTKVHGDGKTIYVNKVVADGTITNVATVTDKAKGESYQATLSVKAGETYYFVVSGSKLGLYGFSFTTMLAPADIPATASVDKDALTAALTAATAASTDATYTVAADADAVEALEDGTWYVMKADHDTFTDAIDAAQWIADAKLAAQSQVDDAVTALTTAVEKFDAAKQRKTAAVDKTELESAIAAATTKSDVYEVADDVTAADVVAGKSFVTKSVKDAYLKAIAAAQAVADSETATQDEVDQAVKDLAAATETFQKAIQTGTKAATKEDLAAAIAEATAAKEGVVTGATAAEVDKGVKFVTEDEMKALTDAIAAAETVNAKADATAEEITAATSALNTAVTAFQNAIKTGAKAEVDTAKLEQAITAAEAAAQTATVSADGTDIATTAKWVTEGAMKALTDAIAAAKEVVETAAAQADVDEAVTTLNAAVTTFEAAKKDGTKTEGGDEPTPGDKTALNSAIAAAKAALDAAKTSADGTDVLTTETWATQADKDALSAAIAAAEALTDTATQTEIDAAKDAIVAAQAKIQAGTNTEGGDTPAPAEVDKTALTTAITAAQTALDAVTTSADGSDVLTADKWVTETDKATLTAAIAAAQTVADNENATQADVDAAVTTLNAAVETFNAAAQPGAKTASKEDLTQAIAAATAAKASVSINAGPASSVTKGVEFVSQTVMDALNEAIEAAQAVADKEDATAEEITQAVSDLNAAVQTFNAAIETGTRTTTTSHSSSRTDTTTTTTTTIRNDDGSVVKTVTTSDGAVNITVTDADGNVTVQVQLPATVPTVSGFIDVPDGHWAEKAINEMAGLGLVKGVDEVSRIYDMTSPITRSSVASILFRFSQGKTGLENIFTDVAEGQWYTDAVAWANKVGVVTGYEDGTFGPDNSITREQLAAMLYRYAKLLGLDLSATGSLSKFDDGSAVQSWATEAMSWAVGTGILQGRGDGTVDPAAATTRAEAAVMLQRFIDLVR